MKGNAKKAFIGLGVTVWLGLGFLSPSFTEAQNALTIGLATPLSGRSADWGRMQKQGADLAVAEINAKGGINGIKFDLIVEDDKADPKEAANVAKKFTADPKIKVVIGHLTTPMSFAAGPIYQRAKVPQIISLASNPNLPKQGDYIFQNTTVQTAESPGAARYAIKHVRAKKVALIYINDDWGASVKEIFPKAVEELGGKIVAIEAYTPGEIDFRTLITKIKNQNPDILYGAYHPAEAAQLVKQAKELGVSFPIYLSSGAQTYSFINLAGPAAEGVVFITGFDPEDPDLYVQDFVKKFKAKFSNETPTVYSALVYDSVMLIAEAIKNIKGEVTQKTIRDGLANLKNIKSLCGTVTPNEFRCFLPRKIIAVVVKDGAFKYQTTVD